MIYRRLDENWDYCFGRGKKDYLTDLDAVAQAIKSRLLLLYGEWWEDLAEGLPLFEQIIGGPATPSNKNAIDIIIRDRIADTQGVLSVVSFESSFADRAYKFTAYVETIYGNLAIGN